MKILEVENINKSFGKNHVLKNVSFSIEKGEVAAIIGSSGGGKSTLLRCLTFLERLDSGSIAINGETIVANEECPAKREKRFALKRKKPGEAEIHEETANNGEFPQIQYRSVYPKDNVLRLKALKMGMVFQDFNLFPHLSVIENLTIAPRKVLNMTKEQAEEIALRMLDKVGLEDKRDAYPSEISGGQKQRVAIARALTMSPEILCFDEPTSALDPELTGEVLKVIGGLRDTGVSMLIVTHELEFARDIADTVIFIDGGEILEKGTPEEVIDNPVMERTKQFLSRFRGESAEGNG